jgi:D-sedoheptulose 7-phosphate isomerase
MTFAKDFLKHVVLTAQKVDLESVENIIEKLGQLKMNNGRLFFLGIGGSAGNCSHAVNDFRKLCNIEAYAPTDNVSELTARANDEGWDTIFSEWLKVSKLTDNDALFIFSVGGGNAEKNVSTNLINAIDYAHLKKACVLGVVGRSDGYTAQNSNACLVIPNVNDKLITPLSESFQSIIWHLIVSHPTLQQNTTKW